jgi:hypothetical protein
VGCAAERICQCGRATPGAELSDDHRLPTFHPCAALRNEVVGRRQLKARAVPEARVVLCVVILVSDENVEDHPSEKLGSIPPRILRVSQQDLTEIRIGGKGPLGVIEIQEGQCAQHQMPVDTTIRILSIEALYEQHVARVDLFKPMSRYLDAGRARESRPPNARLGIDRSLS